MKTSFINWLKRRLPSKNDCKHSTEELKKIMDALESGEPVMIKISPELADNGITRKYSIKRLN